MSHFEHRSANVIVTGASSGIGRATAIEFARAGANVALAARNAEKLDEVAGLIEQMGAKALVVPTDVTDPAAVGKMVEQTRRQFGGVDIMHCNAGFGIMGNVRDLQVEQWRDLFEVDFWGVLHCIYAVLDEMIANRRGQIIITNSLAGRIATPSGTSYSAAKFALWALADGLRTEIAEHNIDVISVHPGFVISRFHEDMGKQGYAGAGADLGARLGGITAEAQAAAIVKASRKRKPQVIMTAGGKIGARLVPFSFHIGEMVRKAIWRKAKDFE